MSFIWQRGFCFLITTSLLALSGCTVSTDLPINVGILVSTIPTDGARDVPVSTDIVIVVVFDGVIKEYTLTCISASGGICNMNIGTPAIKVYGSSRFIRTILTWPVGDPNATDPSNLEFATTYTMQITLNGLAPYQWKFRTIGCSLTGQAITNTYAAGREIWRFPAGFSVVSSPAFDEANCTIYFTSRDKYLYALKDDGTLRWKFRLAGESYQAPAIADDGTVYVTDHHNILYAITPEGSQKWQLPGKGLPTPLIGRDGTIYSIGFDNVLNQRVVYAVSPTGTIKWQFPLGQWIPTGGPGFSTGAIGSDGTVYIYRYALNPDGTLKWQLPPLYSMSSPVIAADGTIYLAADQTLKAINPDGTIKWTTAAGIYGMGPPPAIGQDGTVYMVGAVPPGVATFLLAVDQLDGSLKWAFQLSSNSTESAPCVGSDGTVYVGGGRGILYAINPDGSLQWSFTADNQSNFNVSSPAITSNGTLIVGLTDNNLFAVATNSLGLAASPWPKYQHDNQNSGRSNH